MSIEFVAQEFWDYLSQSEIPIALRIVEGNFLFVETADGDFIEGAVSQYTSTVSAYASPSTDYAAQNNVLTGEITDISATEFSRLISSWNATVTGTGGKTGATLIAGSSNTLEDEESYPVDFEGEITSTLLSMGGAGAIGISFNASDIDWSDGGEDTPNNTLNLIDGTKVPFTLSEVDEADFVAVPNLDQDYVGIGKLPLMASNFVEAAVTSGLPTDWGSSVTIAEALAYPEFVFPAAIIMWSQELAWARDRMQAIKLYLENTVSAQSVTLNFRDDTVDPSVYRDYATGIITYRNIEDNDLGIAATDTYSSTPIIQSLGKVVIPRTLSNAHYGFQSESLYMYKSVDTAYEYEMKVRGAQTEVADTNTYYVVGVNDSSGNWATITGFYANEAAILDAVDAAAFAPWYAVGVSPTVINAWTRYVTVSTGGITNDNGNIKVHRTAIVNIRADYSLPCTTIAIDRCQFGVLANIYPTAHEIWDEETSSWVIDGSWPGNPAIEIADCAIDETSPTFRGFAFPDPYGGTTFAGQTVPELEIEGVPLVIPTATPDFPGATFNMQIGSAAPVYPTYQGAFVYDLELNKWGKMAMPFRCLLDFAPVNTQSSQLLPNARYGVQGGILDATGKIYQFDANPTDAYIKYGKFSLFRLGVTTIQEIIAQFGIQSTGTIETETSLDGKTVELSLNTSYDFTSARSVKAPISRAGVWHNIIFRGQFDLTYVQVNAYRSGRR